MASKPIFITDCKVAEKLGVSQHTFRSYHENGLAPSAVRIGPRFVRWNESEIDEWIAAGCPSRDEWEQLKAGTAEGATVG